MSKPIFGTDGIRGQVGGEHMNPEFVLKLGWAAGKALRSEAKGQAKILIGKDTRLSGYMFESALEAGFSAAGVDVHLLGPMPTPGIAYLTHTFRAQLGVVISASHNPYYDNGIKFFSEQGIKINDALQSKILQYLDQPLEVVDSARLGKAYRVKDAAGRYTEFCKSKVPAQVNLSGLKIVMDCAHGATYHIAPNVLKELGAEVIVMGAAPDGLNINAQIGSTSPKQLQTQVIREQADLGIAFDGDGDRVIMVDAAGELVDGDELLFIIANYYQQTECLNGGVVGTVMSNLGLEHALQQQGIDFVRTKVGDRHVLAELKRAGWHLGGEPSGHIVCLAMTTTGDGIISALQVLAAMHSSGHTLAELTQRITKFPSELVNVAVDKLFDPMSIKTIKQAVTDVETRFDKQGRVLLRASGTEPVIRVYVEGKDTQQVKQSAEHLANVIRSTKL